MMRMLRCDSHDNRCVCLMCARVPVGTDTDTTSRSTSTSTSTSTSSASTTATTAQAGNVNAVETSTPVNAVHSTAEVAGGPATAAAVRAVVAAASPSAAQIPKFLSARVAELDGLKLSTSVSSQAHLVPVLAADMKRKNAAKPVDERLEQSDAQWAAAAEGQITANNTTALTTSDDRYTGITGGAKFDELHEFIHLCSAPGGESPLMGFNLNMNEGAINYFSELVAPERQVPVVERYAPMTKLVRGLVGLVGTEGPAKLFDATFKGDVDGFFNAVGAAYVALGAVRPDGKPKGFGDTRWDAAAAAAEFKAQVSNWSENWLKQRLP